MLTSIQINNFLTNASLKLFEYCRNNNLNYVVTGVSGGLDSAVILGLAARTCKLAKQNNYKLVNVGLILPCYSNPVDQQRAGKVIEVFQAEKMVLPLDEIFDDIKEKYWDKCLEQVRKIANFNESDLIIAQGNIKARLRMMLGTYHVARLLKGIVLSTDNYSEYLMGFWTLGGDVGDFAMIQKVFKGLELYDIARQLGVPESVLQASPDDGLGVTEGGDEGQLGVDYLTLDKIMIEFKQAGFDADTSILVDGIIPKISQKYGVSDAQVRSLWQRGVRSSYKRKGVITLEREELGLPGLDEIELG